MDRNTLLAIALSIAVYSAWLAYQTSHRAEPPPDASRQVEQPATAGGSSGAGGDDAGVNAARQDRAGETADSQPGQEPSPVAATPTAPSQTEPAVPESEIWHGTIHGEHFEAGLTSRGAALTRWTLLDFYQLDRAGKKGELIELVNPDPSHPRALTLPLRELGLGDLSDAVYQVESQAPDRVVFLLERGGMKIRKIYEFDLSGYQFDLRMEVRNDSGHLVTPDFAIELPATVRSGNDYTEESLVALHAGDREKQPIKSVGSPGFFKSLFGSGETEQEVWRDISWTGVDLKYFTSLLLPDPIAGTSATFEPLVKHESAATVLRFEPLEIAPGQSLGRRVSGFLGPKEPEILAGVGREVNRSVDLGYSWFEPLTLFFQWLLSACYRIIPNYGWSIILITILVRVLTLPIMNRQMRSMEKMRALQPRLKEVQAKFSDDRQKQSEATMALYKETGVNPLGGCLPMLLQFPVFIGLFFALKSSFALRQAPFLLWINDLSAPEVLFMVPGLDFPFRLLPLIMGASMVMQQKLTPTTVDPSQQTMMMIMMPVMMTVLFYQFPSGLVLYWMISNFLGIAHQLLIGRRMNRSAA